jgi:hypothetical protein
MIPHVADDMAASMGDWFECADAFLLGRMTSKLLASERPEADRVAQAGAGEGLALELVPGVAEVALAERQDLAGLDREHQDR